MHPGEQYDPAAIERARQDLAASGVFSSVNAAIPDHLAPDGSIPLTFKVVEGPRHAITFNAAYSTDTGATGGATFAYRNVFGNAETLTPRRVADPGGDQRRDQGARLRLHGRLHPAGLAAARPDARLERGPT